jgi:GTP cyclohydrolase III
MMRASTTGSKQANNEPGSSEGMPAKTPAPGRDRPGQAETPRDASDEASLALPHERDQSTDMTDAAPDSQIKQAHTDLGRGLQDTGRTPAVDATYDKLKKR